MSLGLVWFRPQKLGISTYNGHVGSCCQLIKSFDFLQAIFLAKSQCKHTVFSQRPAYRQVCNYQSITLYTGQPTTQSARGRYPIVRMCMPVCQFETCRTLINRSQLAAHSQRWSSKGLVDIDIFQQLSDVRHYILLYLPVKIQCY